MFFFVFLLFSCQSNQSPKVHQGLKSDRAPEDSVLVMGAQQIEELLTLIDGRAVALVGNQSSMVNSKTHLVDTILARGVDLLKVFSPEHGFRGTASAGEKINNSLDPKTGLPIVSLYGNHKKPTAADLEGVALVIFDIQDVGVRFYTYISTLHYVMEACAELNIPLLVLDRPNPNGDYIDGPVLDLKHQSFVGMHPVPIVHGMTIGEYARMINGEYWLKDSMRCSLSTINCLNYKHDLFYDLPIPPSPNLRSAISIRLYPSLCLFEGTSVSVGRGTQTPFELYGHPKMPKDLFHFTPEAQVGAMNPKYEQIVCGGFYLGDIPMSTKFSISYLLNAIAILKNPAALIDKKSFFIKLAGTEDLYNQLISGWSEKEIRETWVEDLERYKEIRSKYLQYN